MTLTRKEFFRHGLFSLGSSLLDLAGLPPSDTEHSEYTEPTPVLLIEGDNLCANAFNEHCLARNCGCFSCVEQCQTEAIQLIPGTGIRIDATRCTGCRTCEDICPTTPKAVRMQRRTP